MIRFFIFVGSLLIITLLAALVVPPFIDWDQYRTRFEQEASRALGFPVHVAGTTSVRLLPLPSVTFSNVTVGRTADARLSASRFHMNMELAPLLKGDLIIADMQLIRPKLDLLFQDDGHINWGPGTEHRRNIGLTSQDVQLERLTIEDGVIRLRDMKAGEELIVKKLNATISARTITGPWKIDGTASYKDQEFTASISTGRWQETGKISLKAAIEPQQHPYNFIFDGPFSLEQGVPHWQGRFTIRPFVAGKNEENSARLTAGKALPVRAEGKLNLTPREITAEAFRLAIGDPADPYIINGTGRMNITGRPQFRITAEGQQINTGRFIKPDSEKEKTSNISLPEKLRAMRQAIALIPPVHAEGVISLYLPAIVSGDTVIREVSLDLATANDHNSWQVHNLKALLPGRTDLRANGQFALKQGLNYKGEILIASRQPSGFVKWLGAKPGEEILNLTSAGISARADISGGNIALEKMEISLNGSQLHGALKRSVKPGEIPALAVQLSGDLINIDQLQALFKVFSDPENPATSAPHNLALKLNADKVIASSVAARGVTADLSWHSGVLQISQLIINDLAGAKIGVSGSLANRAGKIEGAITGTLLARNMTGLIQMFQKQNGAVHPLRDLGALPELTANTDLNFALTGNETNIVLQANGKTGASDITFSTAADNNGTRPADRNFKTKLIVVNPDPVRLLAQIGVPVLPISEPGRAAFRFEAEGSLSGIVNSQGAFTMRDGFISAHGPLRLKLNEGSLTTAGHLEFESQTSNLDRFMMLSGLALPGFGEGRSGKMAGTLTIDAPIYKLSRLIIRSGDQSWNGELQIDTAAKPRPVVTGKLSGSRWNLTSIPALVFGDTSFFANTPPGVNTDETATAGAAATLSGLDARIDIMGTDLAITHNHKFGQKFDQELTGSSGQNSGAQNVQKFSTTAEIRDGDISLNNIEAQWAGGKLSGKVEFARADRARLINGTLKLTGGDLASLNSASEFPDRLSGAADISASFEGGGETFSGLIQNLTGSGTVTVQSGSLTGLSENGLTDLLQKIDAEQNDATTLAQITVEESAMRGGSLSLSASRLPFSVSSGQLRFDNFSIGNNKLMLSGDLRTDLVSGAVSGNIRASYNAGREQIIGANPELTIKISGTSEALKVVYDPTFLSTFLSMRASERREREFKMQRNAILERQRLFLTARLYQVREDARHRARQEKERLKQLERAQAKRRKAEEERRRKQEAEREKLQRLLKDAEKTGTNTAPDADRSRKQEQEVREFTKQAEEAADRLTDWKAQERLIEEIIRQD